MKKFFIFIMIVVPLQVAAQWQSTSSNLRSSQPQKKSTTYKEPFVTLGLHHTGDFYKKSAGAGLGLIMNIGRYQDIMSLTAGVEFIEYLTGDPRPDGEDNGLGIVSAGGQVVIPVTARLHLFPTSKQTKFYIACGAEFGFKAHEGGVLKHIYPDDTALHSRSFAVVPMIGWKCRVADFGVYYKHYVNKPFYDSIDGTRNLGDEKARIGYFLTCYF
ncbi:MAG: hypothetical protein IKH88_14510 [Prevotella sp.]|nr:hypothetical protein [Prevotella sp.]